MVAPDDEHMLQDLVLRRVAQLVDRAEERGGFVPSHVVRYLDRFAHCGDPTRGFALLRCSCGLAKVVPFRCHARALCPTCGGRAMSAGAAHLIDNVLPHVTVRQWVLSVPWPRRYLFARRPELCSGVRRVVWRHIRRWYANRAAALGYPGGDTGAVTVIQRFSSSLALNVHFHMLVLDGVFVPGPNGEPPRWQKVPAPSTEEVQQLVALLARAAEAWLARQGFGTDEPLEEDDPDGQGALLAAAVAGRVAHGKRAGAKVRRLRRAPQRPFRLPPRCGESRGYNLHAGVVIAARDREGLERLCRYVLRPPLARTRLHRRPDGLLILTLRRAYSDGTTEFVFSELELVEKLAALVPPARKNLISYHGVLAPNHGWRKVVVPHTPPAESRGTLRKDPPKHRSRWHPWADLLWRVFEVDGLACPCGRRLVLHAVVLPPATLDVLDSLERSAALRQPPQPASHQRSRAPPCVD
jgi:hypothetical protein